MLWTLALLPFVQEPPPAELPGPTWIYLLVTPSLVVGALVFPPRLLRVGYLVDQEIGRLQAELERVRLDADNRETRKDAIIAAKDGQISAATKTLVDDTVPALVRVAVTMESVQAELRARH